MLFSNRIMNKLLLYSVCFFNLINLQHAVEYEEEDISNQQTYNIHSLIRKSVERLQASKILKDESENLSLDWKFSGLNPDAVLEEYGNLFQNSSRCAGDILHILLKIKNRWALSVFDSFGKPESGILKGNYKWVGDYNECLEVRSTNPNSTIGNFRGKYCSLQTSLSVANMSIPVVTGICVPDSCSTKDLQIMLDIAGGVLNITESLLNITESSLNVSVSCKPTERHLNTPAKAVIALLSIFFTLAVSGSSITILKYFKKVFSESRKTSLVVNASESDPGLAKGDFISRKNSERDDESLIRDDDFTNKREDFLDKLQTFLECFCVFKNGAKLLNTDLSEGQLLCIHGIRFLSMSWVILGHAYAFCFTQIRNPSEAIKLIDNFPFEIVLQGFYSVDSFFVLSGFLLTYLAMKEFAKTEGSISWPYFYIHRYIRLTPIYMVVLGFSATVFLYIGSGPFWPDVDLDPLCRDNWWRNLLYINNFSSMSKQCMGWSWYLANDMQFFVISPLFLITLWRWPTIGFVLIQIFLCACWFSNFFITYHFDLTAGMSNIIGNQNILDFTQAMANYMVYMDKIYIKPYTRIAPYLIGILTGYLVFKHKETKKPKLSWVVLTVGWIIATTITLACVYGLYHKHPSTISSSFYNALHRTTFALGLSWVIYVCLMGQGGFVNSILSYKLFIPLSRLTYAAYLIHPMVITGYYGSLKASFEFSHPTVVYTFLGTMLVTYGLSLPVALVLESPIVSLEKLIRKSFSKKQS